MNAAVVEMLNVPSESPPVPHVSTTGLPRGAIRKGKSHGVSAADVGKKTTPREKVPKTAIRRSEVGGL